MKSITIFKKGATILHDAVLALSAEGQPVFILPANLPAPQLAVHPDGMIVYSVPEREFPRYSEELLAAKEEYTFCVHTPSVERLESHSELRAHGLDLTPEREKETG
jgi:hypothetical protein